MGVSHVRCRRERRHRHPGNDENCTGNKIPAKTPIAKAKKVPRKYNLPQGIIKSKKGGVDLSRISNEMKIDREN